MSQPTRTHEDLPFFNLHYFTSFPFRFEVQLHISFDLIKEFVPRLNVEIEPRIGPAQYHHEKVLVMNEKAIGSKRRIEIILVVLYPTLQMVTREKIHTPPHR